MAAPAELAPDDPAFDVSDPASLRALERAEAAHFWHRARRRYVERRLRALGVRPGARVLDLGCGSGDVAAFLAGRGYRVTAVDGQRILIERARRRDVAVTWWLHDLSKGVADLPPGEFDAVLLLDVLEHLRAPDAALEGALSRVSPGGVLAGTVPALERLWSVVDERAGHLRRYEKRSLRRLVEGVEGADVLEVRPFFRALVPLLYLQRRGIDRWRRGDARRISEANLAVPLAPLNFLLDVTCRLEERLDDAPVLGALPGASLWFALRRC